MAETELTNKNTDVNNTNNSNNTNNTELKTPYTDCPLCLDAFTSNDTIYKTDCDHYFCFDCIVKHLQTSSICPLCRQEIKLIKLLSNNHSNYNLNQLIIRVKFNKQMFELLISNKISYNDFIKQLATQYSLDQSKMKLIHKGKIVNNNSDWKVIIDNYISELSRMATKKTDFNPLTFQLIAAFIVPTSQGKWQDEKQSKCIIS